MLPGLKRSGPTMLPSALGSDTEHNGTLCLLARVGACGKLDAQSSPSPTPHRTGPWTWLACSGRLCCRLHQRFAAREPR